MLSQDDGISKTRKLNNDEETYFKIISDKTASLLSTCCEVGALATTSDDNKIKAMKEFGENLGIAFQIRDDILDYIGTTKVFGKPLGADIKEKKLTLPLIYALKQANPEESKEILKLIKGGTKKLDVARVIQFVKTHNGIDYADETAKQYARKAINRLGIFDDSEAKLGLTALANFVVDRTK